MKRVLLLLIGLACVMPLSARPHGPPPPAPWRPHFRPHPPRWGWGVSVSPWGRAFSLGTRVGRHGFVGAAWPIFPPPVPVVERQTTIVVQQPAQKVIEVEKEAPEEASTVRDPGILPAFSPRADGKPRQLHVEKAVRVINFAKFRDETGSGAPEQVAGGTLRRLTACSYFSCRELALDGTYTECNDRSFTAVNVLSGEGRADGTPFRAGDSFFVPCGEAFTIEGNARIILTCEGEKE